MVISLPAKVIKINQNSVVVEFKDLSRGEAAHSGHFKLNESDFVSVIMPDRKLTICSPIPTVKVESWMW